MVHCRVKEERKKRERWGETEDSGESETGRRGRHTGLPKRGTWGAFQYPNYHTTVFSIPEKSYVLKQSMSNAVCQKYQDILLYTVTICTMQTGIPTAHLKFKVQCSMSQLYAYYMQQYIGQLEYILKVKTKRIRTQPRTRSTTVRLMSQTW